MSRVLYIIRDIVTHSEDKSQTSTGFYIHQIAAHIENQGLGDLSDRNL